MLYYRDYNTHTKTKCTIGTLDISGIFVTGGKKGLGLNVNGGLVVRSGAAIFKSLEISFPLKTRCAQCSITTYD